MHDTPLTILYYEDAFWADLWKIRTTELAEDGIVIEEEGIPEKNPDQPRNGYEWDYHHIDEIYLSGKGGFWIAWWNGEPVGHVSGQDLGEVVELRDMYIIEIYRRRGIGSALVQALMDHVRAQGVTAIELRTMAKGVCCIHT
ncbi:MAG: GNAT family N-acetyltransferase [Anaerolineae bacterium]|nr:GNAT family N-acetyltransferase [Anaerolineae bacterium]